MTEDAQSKVAGFLGLCARAGQLVFGQEACVAAVRKQAAVLALLDAGCSVNTRKRFADACAAHHVPLYTLPEGSLGQAVGKDGRMAATIGPGSMAQKLLGLLEAGRDTEHT